MRKDNKLLKTRRASAFIVDLLIAGNISQFILAVIGMYTPIDLNFRTPFLISLLSGLFIWLFIPILINHSAGEKIFSLKVKSLDGKEPVSRKVLLVRRLFLLLWPLEVLMIIFSKNSLRLGDKLTKTTLCATDKSLLNKINSLSLGLFSIVVLTYLNLICFSFAAGNTVVYNELREELLRQQPGSDLYGTLIHVHHRPEVFELTDKCLNTTTKLIYAKSEQWIDVSLDKIDDKWEINSITLTEKPLVPSYKISDVCD